MNNSNNNNNHHNNKHTDNHSNNDNTNTSTNNTNILTQVLLPPALRGQPEVPRAVQLPGDRGGNNIYNNNVSYHI